MTIAKRMQELLKDIKEGNVLSKYRVDKVIRQDDGSYKHIISEPGKSIRVEHSDDPNRADDLDCMIEFHIPEV